MELEWDARKYRSNLSRHGVAFEDACKIFEGPLVEFEDGREDYGEERWIAIGLSAGRVLVVVFVFRHGRRRIVSARRSTRLEAEHYWRRIYGSE